MYALLAFGFRREFGCDMPEIKKTPVGKPYFPTMPDIHFSLSHSQTHVLCGLSDRPIGVDIESPRVLRRRVIEFFTLPEEALLFAPLELWVLKESYIKLIGGSLPLVKTIRFTRHGEQIIAPDISSEITAIIPGDKVTDVTANKSGDKAADATANNPDDKATGVTVNKPGDETDNKSVNASVSAKLYTVEGCTAAVCACDSICPDSIELIIGSAALI